MRIDYRYVPITHTCNILIHIWANIFYYNSILVANVVLILQMCGDLIDINECMYEKKNIVLNNVVGYLKVFLSFLLVPICDKVIQIGGYQTL